MDKCAFRQLLKERLIFLDGATGTNLQKAGLPSGVCPEKWIYDNPDALVELQKAYVAAGTDILYAPTFTANRIKLAEYGLENQLAEINQMMIKLSRKAAGPHTLVAADLTMTGKQLYPIGDLLFEELVDVYKEQIIAIMEEGADLFVVETMMSLQECRAAVIAIKETYPEMPVMVSLTFNEDGKTLYGTTPDTAMIVLESLGVDVVGLNCSTGPKDMIPLVKKMAEVANIPIMVKPNAGLPILENGQTVYKMSPEEFAEACVELYRVGASVFGGCCGTTPEHIAAQKESLKKYRPHPIEKTTLRVVTSERANTWIDLNGKFMVVGERINPTGKKKLQQDLINGSIQMVMDYAREQEEAGATILDINMGMNGIDEKKMMIDAIYEVTSICDLPLCIDTSHVDIMEAALRIYPGRALINSISCEEGKMKEMLAIAQKYGAMFILLPLSGAGLPKNLEEKKQHIDTILEYALAFGLNREDAIVDVLVQTVGADPTAALECFETIDYCKNVLKLPTICGLSNISFGLPQRAFINAAYLNIAVSRGLTMAIANPSQELLMFTALASDVLMNKEGATEKYIANVHELSVTSAPVATDKSKKNERDSQDASDPVTDCVIKGNKTKIAECIKDALDKGVKPKDIIENSLIPGINKVGDLYDKKKYFLPQLIAGANAMEAGMKILEPLIISDAKEKKATIVFATVEGDIHDIGKNLVVLMLRNYGYNVIDLGKDVPAEKIVQKAIDKDAKIIGLSALMTTTMMKMKDVVDLKNKMGCKAKVIIGGACINESFKDEIGADGYSTDAADCVKLVQSIV